MYLDIFSAKMNRSKFDEKNAKSYRYKVLVSLSIIEEIRLRPVFIHLTNFISTVVQQLDSLKKSDVRARNAIRWLEKQFQAGK